MNLPIGLQPNHHESKPQVLKTSQYELEQFKSQEQIYRPRSRVEKVPSQNIKHPKKTHFLDADKENVEENIFRIEPGVEKRRDRKSVSRSKSRPKVEEKIRCVVKKAGIPVRRKDGRVNGDSKRIGIENRDSFVYAKDKGMSDFVSTSMSNYASSRITNRQTPNNLLSRLSHVFK